MTKNLKQMKKVDLFYQKLRFTYPYPKAFIKYVQATEEASTFKREHPELQKM
jgi:hypothetical protein